MGRREPSLAMLHYFLKINCPIKFYCDYAVYQSIANESHFSTSRNNVRKILSVFWMVTPRLPWLLHTHSQCCTHRCMEERLEFVVSGKVPPRMASEYVICGCLISHSVPSFFSNNSVAISGQKHSNITFWPIVTNTLSCLSEHLWCYQNIF